MRKKADCTRWRLALHDRNAQACCFMTTDAQMCFQLFYLGACMSTVKSRVKVPVRWFVVDLTTFCRRARGAVRDTFLFQQNAACR